MKSIVQKVFVCLAVALLLTTTRVAAQQPAKIPHIGFQLDAPASSAAARIEAFREGLRELGYIEGKNIIIEWRSSDGKPERRSEIAAELGVSKVDVIVSAVRRRRVTRSVKESTLTIPIVMGLRHRSRRQRVRREPGATRWKYNWFVGSLPGDDRQTTGASERDCASTLALAIIGNSTNPGDAQSLREMVLAAGSYEVYLRYLDVQDAKDIESAFQAAAKGHADALRCLG